MENNQFENKPSEEEQNTAAEAQYTASDAENTYTENTETGAKNADAGEQSRSDSSWSSQSGSYRQNDYSGSYQQPPYNGGYQPQPQGSRLATVSMILGILSLAGVCCCAAPGVVLGIAGFITALLAKKEEGSLHGRALAGLICSLIGFALGLASMILGAVVLYAYNANQGTGGGFVMNDSEFENFMEQFGNGNFGGLR